MGVGKKVGEVAFYHGKCKNSELLSDFVLPTTELPNSEGWNGFLCR